MAYGCAGQLRTKSARARDWNVMNRVARFEVDAGKYKRSELNVRNYF